MTTIDRPSDEMTGKVVAKWKDMDAYVPDGRNGYWVRVKHEPGRIVRITDDPRDDLDAAMELLWHLEMKLRPTHSIRKGEGWITGGEYGDGVQEWIPRSGPGLRYGIVRIAAEVMGITEKETTE